MKRMVYKESLKDNISIIKGRYLKNFIHEMNDIRAMYSLGEDISSMEVYFIMQWMI